MEEAKAPVCPCTDACVLQQVMNSIGGKWKLPILCSLTADGPTRYNDLLRKMRGISNTMLAKSLRELERDGLVERQEYLDYLFEAASYCTVDAGTLNTDTRLILLSTCTFEYEEARGVLVGEIT